MAHPAALAAARGLAAQMGSTGAAGPSLDSRPNYDSDDVAGELDERATKDENRQRREFLSRMAEHGFEAGTLEKPKRKSRARDVEADEDEDEDVETERGTRYDEDDDEETQRPMSRRLRKAHAFAEQQGLSKRAVEAMSEQELLVWARKQSRRESRLNRAPKGTARTDAAKSSARAEDVKQQDEAFLAMPSKDVLKGHAKKLAEARGWSDEDADALTSFGEGILESVKLALEPKLRSVVRDQEDRETTALEDERARLEDRFPELSDDEVFDEMRETADWLLEQGRAKNPKDALRKAVRMEFDEDDEYVERRVEAEIESRSSTHRRKGRPMVPRQLRERPARTEEERTSSAMQGVFNKLLAGDKRGAQRTWQKRTRAG
jgi:hypothetical protein